MIQFPFEVELETEVVVQGEDIELVSVSILGVDITAALGTQPEQVALKAIEAHLVDNYAVEIYQQAQGLAVEQAIERREAREDR